MSFSEITFKLLISFEVISAVLINQGGNAENKLRPYLWMRLFLFE